MSIFSAAREKESINQEIGTIELDTTVKEIIPEGILTKSLYIHQENSIRKIREIEEHLYNYESDSTDNIWYSRYLILSDPVGSGKTFTTIARIIQEPYLKEINFKKLETYSNRNITKYIPLSDSYIFYVNKQDLTFKTDMLDKIIYYQELLGFKNTEHFRVKDYMKQLPTVKYWKTNIIVVPHNIVNQWKETFQTFTNLKENVDYYTITGSKNMPKTLGELSKYKFIIISFTAFAKFMSIYFTSCYETKSIYLVCRFIIDEAHTYRSKTSIKYMVRNGDDYVERTIRAVNYKVPSIISWYISSSFNDLVDKNGIINVCSPSFRDAYNFATFAHDITVMNGQENIKKSISLPPKHEYFIRCGLNVYLRCFMEYFMKYFQNTNLIKYLHSGDENIVKLFILKRFDNMDEDNYEVDDNVANNDELSKYNNITLKQAIDTYITNKTNNYARRLEYINNRTYASESGKRNAIDNLTEKINDFNMNVEAYKKSILKSGNQRFVMESAKAGSGSDSDSDSDDEEIDIETLKKKIHDDIFENNVLIKEEKIERVIQHLQMNHPDFKIILSSDYDGIFEKTIKMLEEQKIKYTRLSGTADHISHIIKDFNEGDLKVMYLNSRHMGFGMNLQSATDVMIIHKMNKEQETQVIGRAYRIGRDRELRVWRLYNENEYIFEKVDLSEKDIHKFDSKVDEPEPSPSKKVMEVD